MDITANNNNPELYQKLTIAGLTAITFMIAVLFAILSGQFNMQGGYLIGSLLNKQMGESLKWGMALIELEIFMLPLLGMIIHTGKLTTLLIKGVSYALSVFCLTYAISTGLNNTHIASANTGTDSSIIDSEIQTLKNDIAIINTDIQLLKNQREETAQALKQASPLAVTLIDKIQHEQSLMNDGASCPSSKWRTRCNNIKKYQQQLNNIQSNTSASALKKLDTDIQNERRKANDLAVSITEKERLKQNQKKTTESKAGIFKYKPKNISAEQFSVIIALFLAISLEIVKFGATLQFWKLGIGRLPFQTASENNPQKERLGAFESKQQTPVWLKRLIINFFRYRVGRGSRIEEITAEKLAEKTLQAEAEKEKLDAKISDGKTLLHNITYDQIKDIVDSSYLPGRTHKTAVDDVLNATVLALRNYQPKGKWIADETTRSLKDEHQWLTYSMMRDWVKPILLNDLMLLEQAGRSTIWVDNWEVNKRIYKRNKANKETA